MDRLEVPDALARLDVDGHDALGEQVVAGPHAAVPVVRRRAGRQVDGARLLVDRHVGPDVGVPAVAPRLVAPGVGAEVVAARDGPEDPLHLAGARVVGPHVAGRRLPQGQSGVLHDAADDHRVAGDGDRRRPGHPGGVDLALEAGGEVDVAAGAEAGIAPAGARVQRDQPLVVAGDEDARVVALRVLPIGDPAVVPAHVRGPVEIRVDLRIVGPDRLSGAGVERRHLPERGADVDQPVRHQRDRLELAGTDPLVGLRHGGGERRPAPRDLQVGEVLRVDLIERRVLGVGRVAPYVMPLAVGHLRPRGTADRQDGCRREWNRTTLQTMSHRNILSAVRRLCADLETKRSS